MTINHFPFHIGDFLGGVMHMDGTEIGAYTMLIVAHYQAGAGGLPDDDRKLAQIARLSGKQWARVRATVLAKFSLTDGFWRHSKVVDVIRQIESKSSEQKAKALKRWNTDDATALPDECQPKATSQEPKKEAVVVDAREGPPHVIVGKQISKITGWDQSPNWFGDYARIESWLAAGWNPEADIYPTVKRLMGSYRGAGPPRNLKYFEQAIADAHAYRTSPTPKGTHRENTGRQPTKTERLHAAADEAEREYFAGRERPEILAIEGPGNAEL